MPQKDRDRDTEKRMPRVLPVAAIAACLWFGTAIYHPARADLSFMVDFAQIIASEKFCGLSYHQAGVERLVEENVAADDMSFMSQLKFLTRGEDEELAKMSPSQKLAHCTQVTRVAKTYHLID